MSLQALAPEKTENLVYAILPVSIGLWIASRATANIIDSLGMVAIFAGLGSVLLYELGLDELAIRWWYRRRTHFDNANLNFAFLSCNLFMRNWETTLRFYQA